MKCNGTSEFAKNLHVKWFFFSGFLPQLVFALTLQRRLSHAEHTVTCNERRCRPSRCRLYCWAATATTWSQAAITAWCRCGKLVTSSNSTSTRAATPASEPWTCHMIRGENSLRGLRITDCVLENWQTLNCGTDYNKLTVSSYFTCEIPFL